MRKFIILSAALIFLLSACLPGQSQEDLEGRINTAVAQTMESQNQIDLAVQQTIEVQFGQGGGGDDAGILITTDTPIAIVTDTPFVIPTDTPIFIPTDTPFPSPTPTITLEPNPVSAPATPKPYGCFVSTIRPDYGEVINAGSNFEIRWQVINTGTREWPSGMDVKYASGVKFTNAERVEIPNALGPGESYKISLTGKAPNSTGVKQMTWIVEGNLCYANVSIVVK